MTSSPIRIVVPIDVIGDEAPSLAEVPGPIVVDVDPVTGRDYAEEAWQRAEAEREGLEELAAEASAMAQRTEIHVGLSDVALEALAVRAVYPRRPLWRRIITRIGGAR